MKLYRIRCGAEDNETEKLSKLELYNKFVLGLKKMIILKENCIEKAEKYFPKKSKGVI